MHTAQNGTTQRATARQLAAALFLLPAAAHAALNDTGQMQCYDSSNVVTCDNNFSGDAADRPRQDGRFGRDAASQVPGALNKTGVGDAGFDFTKISNSGNELSSTATPGTGPNDWGCTKDNVTGLMWEVKLDDSTSPRHMNATYTKDSTGGNCNGLSPCDTGTYINSINSPGLCGQTNWRLPNLRELASILHYGKSVAPLIDVDWFPNTASSKYWSSEAAHMNYSWYVDFALSSTSTWYTANSTAYSVRLVFGNEMQVNFQDNGDGTVTDNATGLMWMQCSREQNGANCAGGNAGTYAWIHALQQAATANKNNELGYNDWRLPDIKELQSLVDRGKSGRIDSTFFPATSSNAYWSSTTDMLNSTSAQIISFANGLSGSSGKGTPLFVRLVRGGQSFDLLIPAAETLARTAATATATTFSATLEPYPGSVSATGYWLVRLASAPAPTPDELRNGTPGVTSGNGSTGSGQTQTFTATGLTAGTDYVLYYAAQSGDNMNLIRKLPFTGGLTAAAPTPIPALNGAGLAALALMLGALVARGTAHRRHRK